MEPGPQLPPPDPSALLAPPAAWYPDPGGRHQHRYWDGRVWTATVADDGVAGTDPLPPPPPVTDVEVPMRPAGALPPVPTLGPLDVQTAVTRLRVRLGPLILHQPPELPAAAMATALGRYAGTIRAAEVLLFVDTSQRRNGRSGLLVTPTLVAAHGFGSVHRVPWADIGDVRLTAGTLRINGRTVLSGEVNEGLAELVRVLAARATGSPGAQDAVPSPAVVAAADALAGRRRREPGAIAYTPYTGVEAATTDDRARLTVLTDDVRVGGELDLAVRVKPWPDPKLDAVRIEVVIESTQLVLTKGDPAQAETLIIGQLLAPIGIYSAETTAGGEEQDRTVVATVTLTPAELGPTGQGRAHLRLPDDVPPTLPRIVRWLVHADTERSRALDRHKAVPLTVAAPDPLAAAPPPVDPDDWLLRVIGLQDEYASRLAGGGRLPTVQVLPDVQVAAPGAELTGEVCIRLDERVLAELSPRQRRHAEADGQVKLESVLLVLEAWRGSPVRETCHRLVRVEQRLSGRLTLRLGEERRFPYTAVVPLRAPLEVSTLAGRHIMPTLPSFRPAAVDVAILDEVRWRLVAEAPVAQAFPGRLAPDSLQWAACELIITGPPTTASS